MNLSNGLQSKNTLNISNFSIIKKELIIDCCEWIENIYNNNNKEWYSDWRFSISSMNWKKKKKKVNWLSNRSNPDLPICANRFPKSSNRRNLQFLIWFNNLNQEPKKKALHQLISNANFLLITYIRCGKPQTIGKFLFLFFLKVMDNPISHSNHSNWEEQEERGTMNYVVHLLGLRPQAKEEMFIINRVQI